MSDHEREKFCDDLIDKVKNNPNPLRMKWFIWNCNYELRELFYQRIGFRRDIAIIRMKGKIWGRCDFVIHREMSFVRHNYITSVFISHLNDFINDPFVSNRKLEIFENYIMKNFMRTFKLWISKRIVRTFDIGEEFSETTLIHDW
jgi:hypothetical protein